MARPSQPGRGGGRNPGRGGRGKSSYHKKNDKKDTKKSPNDRKHIFTLVANTKDVRVSTHNTTLKKVYEYLMKNIKEDPEDVVEILKNKKMIDISVPAILVEPPYVKQEGDTNETMELQQSIIESMNSAHQIDWSNQVQETRQRKRRLESNMKLAYTYIFSQFCDKELQSKIEHRSDFDQIEDNPIELLKAIDELMHTISHEKLILPYETLWSTLAQLFEIKQGKDQKLSEYYETMKAFGNQVHKYFDNSFLDKFVMNLEEYNNARDEVGRTGIKEGAWQRLLAYGFLHNADREKYGRLLKGYKSDYANNSDNYPTSMILMKERMSMSYDESKK